MKNKKQANSQNQKHIDQESTISGTPREMYDVLYVKKKINLLEKLQSPFY